MVMSNSNFESARGAFKKKYGNSAFFNEEFIEIYKHMDGSLIHLPRHQSISGMPSLMHQVFLMNRSIFITRRLLMVTPYIIVHEFFHLTQKLIIKDIEFSTL